MIYWLLIFMQMVSTYSPVPICRWIKLQFGQISLPLISLYYFPLLQEFDLKMPSSPFKNLQKFLQLNPAILHPLQLDTGL